MVEILALICILGAIILLVIGLVRVLSPDEDTSSPADSGSASAYRAPSLSTSVGRGADTSARRRASANEQSYYQFTAPTPASCPFCGCENEAGSASCQVCGKPL